MENLREYFKTVEGFGVLSTADKNGNVNAALFARPSIEEGYAVFLTVEKKNLSNLWENPSAYYLFKENSDEGYKGVRLQLSLNRIYKDDKKAQALSRHPLKEGIERYILEFEILKTFPIVGSGE